MLIYYLPLLFRVEGFYFFHNYILALGGRVDKIPYIKICSECEGKSYSADKRDWECPYCGENLDDEELLTPGDLPSND